MDYKELRLKELIRQAHVLVELDKKVVKAILESDFDNIPSLLSKYRETKISVLKIFSELSVVENVDSEIHHILDYVQKDFQTDGILRHLDSKSGSGSSFFDLSWEEADKIGSDLLYSWISHHEFIRDLFRVNTLILRTTIPTELYQYINEVRKCFAFQQYNATISLCRTIIEAAARDIYEKRGLLKTDKDKNSEINPKIFYQILKAISSGELKKRATKLYYKEACPVIHGNRSVTSDQALHILESTTDVVQDLYALNNL